MSRSASNAPVAQAALTPAFDEVVRAHTAGVWRALRYQGVPEADLPDASQEVFMVVHRRLPEFRGEAKLTTWIYEICVRVGRARRRRIVARREDVGAPLDDLASASPRASADAVDARRVLSALLGELPEEQRIVVVLHEIEERPMPEVAAIVGCPVFTAYSRLRLARSKMKELLENEGRRAE